MEISLVVEEKGFKSNPYQLVNDFILNRMTVKSLDMLSKTLVEILSPMKLIWI